MIQWKPIEGFEGLYEVSEDGRVRNSRTTYVLRARLDKDGYRLVSLYRGKPVLKFDRKVHRLVLSAFCRAPAAGEQSNHVNGRRDDNRATNLEWVSCSENHRHAFGALKRSTPWERAVVASKNGKDVYFFQSVTWAGRSGFRRKAIHEVLSGNWRTHRGYEWRYA